MKKGGLKKPEATKPVEGKKDTSKPKGGKVFFGMVVPGRPGKKA